MKQKIYVFVRGGVVQGVRTNCDPDFVDCHVIDYDDIEANNYRGMTREQNEAAQERELCGLTFAEIEKNTTGVY